MSAYVYLLWHANEPRFKIGKAEDIATRIAQLGVTQFDLARAKALEVADCAQALNLERALHRMFQRFRLTPGDSAARAYPGLQDGRRDGDTEWFSAQCWERLHTFIEQNEDLLDCNWVPKDLVQTMVVPYGEEHDRRVLRQQYADIRALYGCALAPQPQPADGKTSLRWSRLHNAGMIPELERKRQDNVLGTVERTAEALRDIAQVCDFVAVVQTPEGYKLVGEAPVRRKSFLKLGFEKLLPLLSGRKSAIRITKDHFFALDLRGAPGMAPEEAGDYATWRERLFWAQKPALPGFDVSLRVGELERAMRILRDVFGMQEPADELALSAGAP